MLGCRLNGWRCSGRGSRLVLPDLGRILEHIADFLLVHPINRFLGNPKGHEALAMIRLASTLGRTALAGPGKMRLHELSLRAHVGMEFGLGKGLARGRRVIGFPGDPVNLNCREGPALAMPPECGRIGYS